MINTTDVCKIHFQVRFGFSSNQIMLILNLVFNKFSIW